MNLVFQKYIYILLILILGSNLYAQDERIRNMVISNTNVKELNAISDNYKFKEEESKKEAIEIAEDKGIPLSGYREDGSYFELKGKDDFGNLVFYSTKNSGSRLTARVNPISTGGELGLNLDGQNMIVGVWDFGVAQKSHIEFSDRVIHKDYDPKIAFKKTNHATHVTGTIASAGTNKIKSKGIAPKVTVWSNDWSNDIKEMAEQAAAGLLVSNHSYGIDTENPNNPVPVWKFGYYDKYAKEYDEISYNAPNYQIVAAAGNDRISYEKLNPSKEGNDLLLGSSLAKNSVVVAAVKEVLNYTSSKQVEMTSFSSFGPTDDFRIKPDISAKGYRVYSTSYIDPTVTRPEVYNRYDTYSGTSMATPAISGVLVLWQQYGIQLNESAYKSATLRALLIQTADDAGDNPGPDQKFGWGLVNAKRGVEVINNNVLGTAYIGEQTLLQGGVYEKEFVVNSDGIDLSATVAWTDKEKTPFFSYYYDEILDRRNPTLVNDLDLRIFKDGVEYFPWKLNRDFNFIYALKGDNVVDNVEKVEIPNAESGTYKIVVTHKGNLVDNKQDFSVVISSKTASRNYLSINDNTLLDNDIKVWPNPATDFVNVESTLDNLKNAEITLFDITGKELFKIRNNDSFSNIIKIPLNNLSKGVYILQIKNDNLHTVKKILVN